MFSSRPIARILAAACAIAVALTACSAEPTPAPEATLVIQPTIFAPTDTPAPTATPEPTATPVPPQPITVLTSGGIDSLHPFYATSQAARDVLGALFVGCVGQDDQHNPLALGCESAPNAANGGAQFIGEGADRYLQATFKIRPGWRWTDGRPVTAQDALFAWQLIMAPESGLRDPLTQSVYSMQALDERTIAVQFMSAAQAQAAATGALRGDVPFEYFSQLGDYAAYANRATPLAPRDYWAVVRWLPSHLLRDLLPSQHRDSNFARQPVGDGAYEIASVEPNRVLLRPSAQPFSTGAVANSGIVFMLDGQPSTPDAPLIAPSSAAIDAGDVTPITYTSGLEKLVLNVDRFPFEDVRVRQAVAHAIHRTDLGQDPALSQAVPTALTYDPAKAAALLAEAGWACDPKPCQKAFTDDAGQTVTRTLAFRLTTNEREPRNAVAQAIQKQLAEVGFAVDAEIVFGLGRQSRLFAPYDQGGTLLTRNFDAALYQSPAPGSAYGEFACASIPTAEANDASQGNASGFCDPEVDALLNEAEGGESVIADPSAPLFQALAKIQQAAPVVPLYEVVQRVAVKGVDGVRPAAQLPITWNAWAWATE
jgi:ABC-type transport system substrate-binding protein